ncbi:MAG TPA: hypothetical protein VMV72_13850 [Verrucomicrobiae bacterium]|nr:hypothetical protein [Verrucomicrobiae bacterium]
MGRGQSRRIALAVIVVIGLTGVALGTSDDAVVTEPGSASKRVVQYCGPACELQAQDSAFALLIEVYRQFQTRQIQVDYERRLQAASKLGREGDSLVIGTTLNGTATLGTCVRTLAEKERDLRLEQLQTRVLNFATAYRCVRKDDEMAVGQPVTSKIDPSAASRELKTLRVLALDPASTGDYHAVVSKPAASLFLDSAPAQPWPDQVVNAFDDAPAAAAFTKPVH